MTLIVFSGFLFSLFFWFIYIYLRESEKDKLEIIRQNKISQGDDDPGPDHLFSGSESVLCLFFKWMSLLLLIGFFFQLKIYISINPLYEPYDIINNAFIILSGLTFLLVAVLDGLFLMKHTLEENVKLGE